MPAYLHKEAFKRNHICGGPTNLSQMLHYSCALGVAGYLVVMLTLLGVNLMFRAKPQTWMDLGLLLLFYGLYYGLLGRDISEIITDRMACTIGVCMHLVRLFSS